MSEPRVLLINNNSLKPPVAPVGLDYLASDLKHRDIKPVIADLIWSNDSLGELKKRIDKEDLDLISLTIRNLDDSSGESKEFFLNSYREIISWIQNNYSVPVVLGGCGFSIMPEEVLKYCGASFGIWGEGENFLSQLIYALHEGRSYYHIPGLLYWWKGEVVSNPPEYCCLTEMEHLAERNHIDNYLYFIKGGQGNIETKRGCNQACLYCADPLSRGQEVRLRSPDHVVKELFNLLEQGVNCFHFCDSEFNLPLDHAEEICRAIIKSGINKKFSWYAYCSPWPFTPFLAYLMKEAGCTGINFGVDSGSDLMLSKLGRSHNREAIKNMARACHESGIVFMADLLLGGPGENKDTIKESIDLMKEINPLAVGISLGIRVYKNTPFYRELKKEGLTRHREHFHREAEEEEDLLFPLYYLSSEVGSDAKEYIRKLIDGDRRFLSFAAPSPELDYNYADNQVLMEAVSKGYRGAYWHILRQL